MSCLTILGAGSWGTALAIALGPKFERVRLWAHDDGLAAAINQTGENSVYLPGFPLPPQVHATEHIEEAIEGAAAVLVVVPSQHLRRVVRAACPWLTAQATLVSAAKGIERNSLCRMSDILRQETHARVAVLSGPTFAREVAAGEPAAVVVASEDRVVAADVQAAFSGPALRLYTNPDVTGVEVGAALKNVVAIAAGVVSGLGLGNNTLAALVTRGLAEISRLAVAMGANERTLAGLAGLGDLLLTCTGDLSRNRRVGMLLAQGQTLDAITSSTRMIAEGVETTWAAIELAQRYRVEMPIIEQMAMVLRDGKSPRDGIRDLMERTLKSE